LTARADERLDGIAEAAGREFLKNADPVVAQLMSAAERRPR
jgi:hypothetical protein